jgi:hypothetical protein
VTQPVAAIPTAAYLRPFRRYQSLALDAFDAGRKAARDRCYVVMPPGSGKTVVGLEIARRLGRKTVIFGPNTAIQAQWVSQWGDFGPRTLAATTTSLAADVTVLTYQALCTLDNDVDLDALAPPGPDDPEAEAEGLVAVPAPGPATATASDASTAPLAAVPGRSGRHTGTWRRRRSGSTSAALSGCPERRWPGAAPPEPRPG